MIKAIIFDYGGVISNNIDSIILEQISEFLNIPLNVTKKALSEILEKYQKGLIDNKKFWKEFKDKTGAILPKDNLRLWTKTYEKEIKTNKKLLSLIKQLKQKYTLALLSNTIPPHAEYNKIHKNFELFDHVILSNEVGSRKPDKRIYQLVLERLELKPENCVYIDDIKEYLVPAEKLGMHTIQYQNIYQLKMELSKAGVNI